MGPAVEAGFVFHHAEPDYVMLTRWLPATENKLPHNASHQVGPLQSVSSDLKNRNGAFFKGKKMNYFHSFLDEK